MLYNLGAMKARDLQLARCRRGWNQKEAAARLGLSQPYVSMLETGRRAVTSSLARKLVRLYALPPTVLPVSESPRSLGPTDNQTLAEELAKLGYPGFAYLGTRRRSKNPAEVLLVALAMDDLEARVTEGLPWLLLHYEDLDASWLCEQARLRNLQNRLGFVVNLARRVAETNPRYQNQAQSLRELEMELDRSRLVHEDTLCQCSLTEGERGWLRENRPEEAKHWNLLTDWRPETLRYGA